MIFSCPRLFLSFLGKKKKHNYLDYIFAIRSDAPSRMIEEDRYTILMEKGKFSEIPTKWLEVFLKRAEQRLNVVEHGVGESGAFLRKRIENIKEELAWRNARNILFDQQTCEETML